MQKLVLSILLCVVLTAHAQNEFYNQGADIYIQKGALIHVQGELINNDGPGNGSINNDGIIEVKGDFDNQIGADLKVHTDNTSTDRAVKFVGSGKQLIKGSLMGTGTSSFYNLVIDKAAASDSVEMQANVLIEGGLIFGNTTNATYNPSNAWTNNNLKGLLKTYTSTTEYLLDIQNGAIGAIAGYPTLTMNGNPGSGFVVTRGNKGSANGGLQRRVNSNAAYVFPIGTEVNGYNAVSLNFSAQAAGNIKGKFCDNSGFVGQISQFCNGCIQSASNPNPGYGPDNSGYNRYYTSNPCNSGVPQWFILEGDAIQNHGYWSFESSNNGYTYTIETFPNQFGMLGNATDTWRTLKYASDYSDDPSDPSDDWRTQIESSISSLNDLLLYSLNTGTGCYTGNGVPGGVYSNFSHFALFKSKINNALPVELIYLEANGIDNEYIKISWATAIEINNAGFEVQRSTDGINFTNIGWVAGSNNSTTTNTYFYDDVNVVPNVIYYYRLRQVDNDGQSEQTNIVSAMVTAGEVFTISEFIPNPSINLTKLVFTASISQNVEIKIFDVLGRIVSETKAQLQPGQTVIGFESNELAAGNYTAAISNGNQVYNRRLNIMK
ncbi:MAG: T9SS type A sorting domain-containing protein [Bacteroidetes bacterium]|nr:T9SS type A sorting domain-containing protein [Bacteroidota bacterium]